MIPNNIKQHDFISGKPKTSFGWTAIQSNCRLTPPSDGRSSYAFERLVESAERNGFTVPNFDYMHLYPEIQRSHNIVPEGHITTENNPNPCRELVDQLVRQRIEQRERDRYETMVEMTDSERIMNKILLNTTY
jgi:DNA polymerase elongation subunit (family B)